MKDFKTLRINKYKTYLNEFLGGSFYSRKQLFKLSMKQSQERSDLLYGCYKDVDISNWDKEYADKWDTTIALLNLYTIYKKLINDTL